MGPGTKYHEISAAMTRNDVEVLAFTKEEFLALLEDRATNSPELKSLKKNGMRLFIRILARRVRSRQD